MVGWYCKQPAKSIDWATREASPGKAGISSQEQSNMDEAMCRSMVEGGPEVLPREVVKGSFNERL